MNECVIVEWFSKFSEVALQNEMVQPRKPHKSKYNKHILTDLRVSQSTNMKVSVGNTTICYRLTTSGSEQIYKVIVSNKIRQDDVVQRKQKHWQSQRCHMKQTAFTQRSNFPRPSQLLHDELHKREHCITEGVINIATLNDHSDMQYMWN